MYVKDLHTCMCWRPHLHDCEAFSSNTNGCTYTEKEAEKAAQLREQASLDIQHVFNLLIFTYFHQNTYTQRYKMNQHLRKQFILHTYTHPNTHTHTHTGRKSRSAQGQGCLHNQYIFMYVYSSHKKNIHTHTHTYTCTGRKSRSAQGARMPS
jgi:hypothetical protein